MKNGGIERERGARSEQCGTLWPNLWVGVGYRVGQSAGERREGWREKGESILITRTLYAIMCRILLHKLLLKLPGEFQPALKSILISFDYNLAQCIDNDDTVMKRMT